MNQAGQTRRKKGLVAINLRSFGSKLTERWFRDVAALPDTQAKIDFFGHSPSVARDEPGSIRRFAAITFLTSSQSRSYLVCQQNSRSVRTLATAAQRP